MRLGEEKKSQSSKDEKRRSGTTTKPVLIIIFIFRHDGANPPPRFARRGSSLSLSPGGIRSPLRSRSRAHRDGIDIAV